MLGLRRGQYRADAGIQHQSLGFPAGIKERSVWS